jgi:hypothetical protein
MPIGRQQPLAPTENHARRLLQNQVVKELVSRSSIFTSRDRDQRLPNDTNWTGAEVKACCRLSALLDMPLVQAAQNIVPVAVTSAESVERLRSWASGRCLSADKPGIYKFTSGSGKTRRKIPRNPSLN